MNSAVASWNPPWIEEAYRGGGSKGKGVALCFAALHESAYVAQIRRASFPEECPLVGVKLPSRRLYPACSKDTPQDHCGKLFGAASVHY
jgi:hypothetical protein